MKITGLTVAVFGERPDAGQEVKESKFTNTRQLGTATFHTNEGIDGVVVAGALELQQLVRLWRIARDHIEGKDPLDRGNIEHLLDRRFRWPMRIRGILDYGLWDIAGKHFNQPIYKLLGATREKVLAYGSTVHHDSDEKFLDTVMACKDMGFKAIKLHPYAVVEDDIRLCRKVRKAVGDDMILMIDPLQYPGPFNRSQAMRVGRVLDELNFLWFEDPLDKRDLEGLADLTSNLAVEIRVSDRVEDWREYNYMIRARAMDVIAGPSSTGITDLMKLSALAEANFLGFEPHDYGGGGMASLHVLLAVTTARFFEKAVPLGRMFEDPYPGVFLNIPKVDSEGYVHGPAAPGLGLQLDPAAVKAVTSDVLRV